MEARLEELTPQSKLLGGSEAEKGERPLRWTVDWKAGGSMGGAGRDGLTEGWEFLPDFRTLRNLEGLGTSTGLGLFG
jgi:hypothetical protein